MLALHIRNRFAILSSVIVISVRNRRQGRLPAISFPSVLQPDTVNYRD